MKKIDKDKFKKEYVRAYSRVFSKKDLQDERRGLQKRVDEIDEMLGEMETADEDD